MMKTTQYFVLLSLVLALTLAASPTYAQMHAPQVQGMSLGLKGSWLDPLGHLSDIADDGWGGTFSLGVLMNPNLLVEGLVSYHDFGVKEYTSRGDIDGGFVPLELGFTAYLGYPGGIRPYLKGHGGWYIATGDFKDSNFGMGGSVGLDIPVSPQVSLQVEPQYTMVFRDELDEYWGINVGLAFNMAPHSQVQR